jgi:hypothetical protein
MNEKREYLLRILQLVAENIAKVERKNTQIKADVTIISERMNVSVTFFDNDSDNFSINLYEFQTIERITTIKEEIFNLLDGDEEEILKRIGE